MIYWSIFSIVVCVIAWMVVLTQLRLAEQPPPLPPVEPFYPLEGDKRIVSIRGSGYAVSDREAVLTDMMMGRDNQYSYMDVGPAVEFGDAFSVHLEFMFETHLFYPELQHAVFWIGIFGDPRTETAKSSLFFEDGGLRFYVLHHGYNRAETSCGVYKGEDFHLQEPLLGAVRPSDWTRLSLRFDASSMALQAILGDQGRVLNFDASSSPWTSRTDRGRLYIGAKTLKKHGIRIRKMFVRHSESVTKIVPCAA